MSHIAEFKIIGRVGAIKEVGSTVRVTIASSYSYKDRQGDWIEQAKWNEITIFNEATQAYVQRNLEKGDLVYAAGTLAQTSYKKDGEMVYGMTLGCEQIERLAKSSSGEDASEGREPRRAAKALQDDDVPF
ncbi:single-stranded DNA-binding protein [Methylocella tundrae]|uniref:Single-stranded DNA-binding protein n=1 Tax=Methylocella tundrae TaxID=227605 RepID=A0A4U8Z7K4_METTU|nr:single-stranded DNA-binding protein [Methylocella tundrae]WPP02775.1 single-stranded DNA-binding protein [Methylocella tundrae]VFU17557.1 Single-strand binding protein family protein [Methylocella tundrae]